MALTEAMFFVFFNYSFLFASSVLFLRSNRRQKRNKMTASVCVLTTALRSDQSELLFRN